MQKLAFTTGKNNGLFKGKRYFTIFLVLSCQYHVPIVIKHSSGGSSRAYSDDKLLTFSTLGPEANVNLLEVSVLSAWDPGNSHVDN